MLPYDESSGLIAELVGHLASLLMQLNRWRQVLTQARSLDQWLPVCREMLTIFFLPDQDTEAALTLIEQQWQAIIAQGVQSQYGGEVPLSLLRDELAQRLDQERISQRFLAGPINICTLMPMRSIPFKVVCLLGMNDGIYPRALAPLGFDLMSQKPVRGDRSRRDDDRYLFLEAMMSAEALYISYIGSLIQDNSERYPSVLVQELLDYIGQSHCLVGDEGLNCDESEQRVKEHIMHQHSRMPFDQKTIGPMSAKAMPMSGWRRPVSRARPTLILFSRLNRWRALPDAAAGTTTALLASSGGGLFQLRLQVNFRSEESDIPDTEPFTLEGLTRYQLNQQLLNTLIEQQEPDRMYLALPCGG
ncbi:hypothetical protein ACLK2C_15030 [Escherichia coli]